MKTPKSTKKSPAAMLGMNVTRGEIECVMFHSGRILSTLIDNSEQGFDKLVDWLNKHDVHSVHAFCDIGAEEWQEAAAFLKHAGHRVTVLNESQIRACTAVLCSQMETDDSVPA